MEAPNCVSDRVNFEFKAGKIMDGWMNYDLSAKCSETPDP